MGGVDKTSLKLYSVYSHGWSDVLQYATMGSGKEAAMGVLEEGWKPGMSEEDATILVGNTISVGIMTDLGSGFNVGACVVRRENSEYIRSYKKLGNPRKKPAPVEIKSGTTEVLEITVKYF